MIVKDLKKILNDVNENGEIILSIIMEDNKCSPFKNIECEIFNKDSSLAKVYLKASIFKEYENAHFPDNLTKEDVEMLLDKWKIIQEELEDIQMELKKYKLL